MFFIRNVKDNTHCISVQVVTNTRVSCHILFYDLCSIHTLTPSQCLWTVRVRNARLWWKVRTNRMWKMHSHGTEELVDVCVHTHITCTHGTHIHMHIHMHMIVGHIVALQKHLDTQGPDELRICQSWVLWDSREKWVLWVEGVVVSCSGGTLRENPPSLPTPIEDVQGPRDKTGQHWEVISMWLGAILLTNPRGSQPQTVPFLI